MTHNPKVFEARRQVQLARERLIQAARELSCQCGHAIYMHGGVNGPCNVSDHLELVCTCTGFQQTSRPE